MKSKSLDSIREYNREYYKNNRDRYLLRKRKYYKSNKDMHDNTRMKRVYGITKEEFNDQKKIQDGKCCICNSPNNIKNRELAIDHCHTEGHVRGLLCDSCNKGLGMFKDNIGILYSAIEYLIGDDNAE